MFKFRLAGILHLREYQEKLCLEEVGKCLGQLRQALAQKEVIKQNIIKGEKQYSTVLNGFLLVDQLSWSQAYLGSQYNLLVLQEKVVQEKNKALKKARLQLEKAMCARKILDKLREKEYWRYQEEEGRRAQILQDELALTSQRRLSDKI